MWTYAHVVVYGVPIVCALYIILSIAFSWRDRNAEREAGR